MLRVFVRLTDVAERRRLNELVSAATLELKLVPCSCPPGPKALTVATTPKLRLSPCSWPWCWRGAGIRGIGSTFVCGSTNWPPGLG